MAPARTDRQAGGVLIAVVIALVIVALAVFAKTLLQEVERKFDTQLAIRATLGNADSKIDKALTVFVTQNKRLPCPANGTTPSGTLNAGVEMLVAGICSPATQINGVVPWVTLGLSEEDAADPWHARITYRVQAELARNSAPLLMDMSWCDSAGTPSGAVGLSLSCVSGCNGTACTNPLNFLYSKGLQVQDGTGAWLNQPKPLWTGMPLPPPPNSSGAAYVLISHGPTGGGAYNAGGVLQPGSVALGTNEILNRANQTLTVTTVFMDAAQNSASDSGHFDDYLSHPSIQTVLDRANLGARSH